MDATRLKSLPLFQDVPDEELSQIATFAQEVLVDEGRELVREGDFSYEFMAIEEGEAEVSRHGEHLADLGPGDFFGEIGLLAQERRVASVTATSPMSLVVLTGAQLRAIESRMASVGQRIRQAMADRMEADRARSS